MFLNKILFHRTFRKSNVFSTCKLTVEKIELIYREDDFKHDMDIFKINYETDCKT